MQKKNQGTALQGDPQQKSQNNAQQGQGAAKQNNQGVPLNAKEQQQSQQMDQQIQQFEQQLQSKSNTELKQISGQLETVERQMLLEKIDNELQTMKETIVKPGDIASTAAAGAASAAATQVQSASMEKSNTH